MGSPFRGGGAGTEGESGGERRLGFGLVLRGEVGKSRDRPPSSTSGRDKYEGDEQSDKDEPGESNNGDEECVELDPRSHPFLRMTAANLISRYRVLP